MAFVCFNTICDYNSSTQATAYNHLSYWTKCYSHESALSFAKSFSRLSSILNEIRIYFALLNS